MSKITAITEPTVGPGEEDELEALAADEAAAAAMDAAVASESAEATELLTQQRLRLQRLTL
jgi:hypothetical protein